MLESIVSIRQAPTEPLGPLKSNVAKQNDKVTRKFQLGDKVLEAVSVSEFSKVNDNGWHHVHHNDVDYIFLHEKDEKGKSKFYFAEKYQVNNGKVSGGKHYDNPQDFIQDGSHGVGEHAAVSESLPNEDATSCKIGFSGLIKEEAIGKLERSSQSAAQRLLENDLLDRFQEDREECVTDQEADEIRDWALIMRPSLKNDDGKMEDSAYSYGLKHFTQNFKFDGKEDSEVTSAKELKEMMRSGKDFTWEKYLEIKKLKKESEKAAKTGKDEIKIWLKKKKESIKKRIEEIKEALPEAQKKFAPKAIENEEKAGGIEGYAELKEVKELRELNDELVVLESDEGYKDELEKREKELEELSARSEKYEDDKKKFVEGLKSSLEKQAKAKAKILKIAKEVENFFMGKDYSFKGLVSSMDEFKSLIVGEHAMNQIRKAFVKGVKRKQGQAESALSTKNPFDPRLITGVLYVCEKAENADKNYKKRYTDDDISRKRIRKRSDRELKRDLNKNTIKNFRKEDGYSYLGNGQLFANKPADGEPSTAVLKDVKVPEGYRIEGDSADTKYDLKIDDFGPEVRVSSRKSGSEGPWTRLDREEKDGKLHKERMLLVHDPKQEENGRVYAFNGGRKYLLTKREAKQISNGTANWSDVAHKRYTGASRIDFHRTNKGAFEVALPKFGNPAQRSVRKRRTEESTSAPDSKLEEKPSQKPQASFNIIIYSLDGCEACVRETENIMRIYNENKAIFKNNNVNIQTILYYRDRIKSEGPWNALPWGLDTKKLVINQQDYVRIDGTRSSTFPQVDINGKAVANSSVSFIMGEINKYIKGPQKIQVKLGE